MYNNIRISGCLFGTSASIFIICLLSFISLFFYLVGVHYPFEKWEKRSDVYPFEVLEKYPGWTEEEKTAFTSLFVLGGISFLATAIFGCVSDCYVRSVSTEHGGNVAPQLIE